MTYYRIKDGGLVGPISASGIAELTQCGNPELLDLEQYGIVPLLHDTDDAPFGYSTPVLETRDGRQVAIQYALGTTEERAAETLRLWRATTTCTPLQGEIILAEEALRTGWLALVATLSEVDQIRYLRAERWRRDDPLMDGAIAHLRPDLSDDARALYLDDLFRRAVTSNA